MLEQNGLARMFFLCLGKTVCLVTRKCRERGKQVSQHRGCSQIRFGGMPRDSTAHAWKWRPCGHGLGIWTLIETKNDHVCSNRILKQGREVSKSTLHSEDPSPTLPQEAEVFKVGRSTGHTTGKWSDMKHAQGGRWQGSQRGKISSQYMYITE